MPTLGFTSYFHLFDFEHFPRKYTYHYGLLRDGSCSRKPSFFVLRSLKYLLDDGNAKPDASSFIDFCGISERKEKLIHCSVFKRNDLPFFAYWQATDISRNALFYFANARCFAGTAAKFTFPILADPFTGTVWKVPIAENGELKVPVMDHPLFLTDLAALEPYLHINRQTTGKETAFLPNATMNEHSEKAFRKQDCQNQAGFDMNKFRLIFESIKSRASFST